MVTGNGAKAANAKVRAGEGPTLNHVFGLFYVNKLVKEAVGCVYVHQVCVHLVLEYVDNLFAFAFAHKAMVYMYADQLLGNSFD